MPRKQSPKITNLRLVKVRNGSLGWDGYTPPQWAVLFYRDDSPRRADVRIRRPDANRPTGQEVIDAMADYVRRKEVSEESLLDMPIVE